MAGEHRNELKRTNETSAGDHGAAIPCTGSTVALHRNLSRGSYTPMPGVSTAVRMDGGSLYIATPPKLKA